MKGLVLCDEQELTKVAPLCREYKCGIEVQSICYPSYFHQHPDGIELHKKELKDIELISFHGAFFDLCPGSKDELIREVTRKRFDFAYENAVKVNAKHIILHHGHVPKTSSPVGWIQRITAFWQDYLKDKNSDVFFHLENVLEYDAELLSEVIESIGSKNVDVCLDIGHAHCNSRITVQEWIKTLKDKIGYVHLHDNYGQYDEHFGFGDGNIPLIDVCETLEKYSPDAIWAIETIVDKKESSLLWLKENNFCQ